jgi:galacturonosyltransferase
MRVLLVANKDITLSLFRKEFIEELIILNHEVYILSPYGKKLDYFSSIGAKLIDYSIDRRGKNPLSEVKILVKFNRIISEIRPEYVFTYTIKPNIYMGIISRFRSMRFIPTITGLGSTLNHKGILKHIILRLYKISFKKTYIAFFQNTVNLEWFKSKINNRINTRLVNGSGVNVDKFMYNKLILTGITKFLFLGRIMKDKGIEEFLSVALKLKNKYHNEVEFIIAGFIEDDYNNQIQKMQTEGIVKYLGFVDDTYNVLIECTVVVLPSYHEGLSNVLLEAQSVGRPVIATDIPGCRETFIDGKSGLAVKVKSSIDLYEKMEHFHLLSDNQKIEMSINGRNHIEKIFDRRKVIYEYVNVITNGGK